MPGMAPSPGDGGHLAENIAYFGRALRAAGMHVGPGAVLDAVAAVEAIGIGRREEFRAALAAAFLKRRQDAALFDQAFRLFWRRRALLEKMMAVLMPIAPADQQDRRQEAFRRVTEALFAGRKPEEAAERQRIELDSRLTVSDVELFRARDFEAMSAAEIAEAKRAIAALVMPDQRVRMRRFRPDPRGNRADQRAAMRATLRAGGAAFELRFRTPRETVPPLVALCDISGSMSRYSRIFLHFMHALALTGRRVHGFTFATGLTNISRALRATKDPDLALQGASKLVRDWDGGTRIGATLEAFNKTWARRVLAGGAVVLLITDGLEREVTPVLAREMARLRRSCRRLIWLNPLLRYEGFEAKAAGIRAMLPHVDEFRTLHSLDSIADLCRALAAGGSRDADPARYLKGLS
ncbi:MAG: VWA domain-containing protein [Hyphomicrobiales bacterium]|nr:VWA domain-containing protein [Hyphomicrobiales bacterium]MCA1999742.1 VWA domain-containing protein [Hyphomicrobiales bacterium]